MLDLSHPTLTTSTPPTLLWWLLFQQKTGASTTATTTAAPGVRRGPSPGVPIAAAAAPAGSRCRPRIGSVRVMGLGLSAFYRYTILKQCLEVDLVVCN